MIFNKQWIFAITAVLWAFSLGCSFNLEYMTLIMISTIRLRGHDGSLKLLIIRKASSTKIFHQ